MLKILTWNATTTAFDKLPEESFQDVSVSPLTVSQRELLTPRPVLATVKPEIAVPPPSLPSPPASSVASSQSDSKMSTDEPSPAQITSRQDARLATMRQTISTQLNLEILVKHRELRLIDQEIAKAQVALEQLRRCSEIPFPGTQAPSQQVSSGKGAAIRKADKRAAKSPAPWGVADGPYTRHYARWLLPDPHFDGGEHEAIRLPPVIPAHGHSTRGHYTDFAQMVGKTSRSNRALHNGLPAGYAEPKQKPTGPMILKRKSDGKMVKLVCPDCHRFDFGSAQGFINHCRIGHQRNFASHDAAAEGCGQLLDGDETIPVQTPVTEAPTPFASLPATPIVATPPLLTPAATPVSQPMFTASGSVHALVKSAHTTSKDVLTKPLINGYVAKLQKKRKADSIVTGPPSLTPNLAAFVQKHGIEVNLGEAVQDARMKYEHDEDSDEHMDMDSPLPTPAIGGRTLQGAGKKLSSKSTGLGKSRKPSFVQHPELEDDSLARINTSEHSSVFNQFMPLIPSPTNDSTQAPSLIDDDEEMDPQSPPSCDEVEDDVHFHVRDDEQFEDSELRNELPTPTCAQPQQELDNALPTARPVSSKADQPYTFIAEQPFVEEHDRKRRRLGD